MAGKSFCEFFAGIGLVREALGASGWACAYANDIDANKARLYRARFGPSDELHLGDVWDTASVAARIEGRPFLATASFPCVDLSLAGHRRGLDGAHSSAFHGFVRVLEALGERRPSAVLVENVAGFVTGGGGKDFAAAATALGESGYRLDAFLLDAADFVPQSRPRVFLLGVEPGSAPEAEVVASWCRPEKMARLMASIPLPHGWCSHDLPRPPARERSLADVLDLGDEQEWWGPAETERHRRMMSDRHRAGVESRLGGRFVATAFRRVRHGAQRLEVRFDGLAGCLRTPRGGSARQIVVAMDGGRLRMRWMSPRECARLQGADDFPLVGATTGQLFGFGDAVCVPVVAWIDRWVLTPLAEGGEGRTHARVHRREGIERPSPSGRRGGASARRRLDEAPTAG